MEEKIKSSPSPLCICKALCNSGSIYHTMEEFLVQRHNRLPPDRSPISFRPPPNNPITRTFVASEANKSNA